MMLTEVVQMFNRVGLQTTVVNEKEMVFTSSFVWGQHGDAVYTWRETGEGGMFRDRKKNRVS